MSGQGPCHLSEPFSVYSDVRVGRLSSKSGRGQCHLWEPKQMKGERDAEAGGGLLVTPLWWLWSEVPDRSNQTSDWGKVHFDLWFIVAGKVAWWWRCRERDEGWCSAPFYSMWDPRRGAIHRADLLTSVNPVQKLSHRHILKFVSQMILDPVTLTVLTIIEANAWGLGRPLEAGKVSRTLFPCCIKMSLIL